MVPLAFTASPYVIDNGTRNAALRVVSIDLELPEAFVQHAVQVALCAKRPDVAILTSCRRVVSHRTVLTFAKVAELVFAR